MGDVAPNVIHASPRRAVSASDFGPAAAIRDRESRCLHGRGTDTCLMHGVVVAAVGHDLFGEQPVEEFDELVEAGDESRRGERLLAEHGGIEPETARADAEHEPARRDVVEGHGVLRERHGMAMVR